MELKELAKEWRIWVLIAFLVVSLIGLGPAPKDTNGDNTPDTYVFENLNSSLGIDFTGGSQLTLKVQNNDSEQMTRQVSNILGQRLDTLGLGGDASPRRVGENWRISVETPETNSSRVERLIAQEGSFRATMPFLVQESRNFTVEDTYNFRVAGEKVEVGTYSGNGFELLANLSTGESVQAGRTRFFHVEQDGQYHRMEVLVYDNDDIQSIQRNAQSGYGISGGPTAGYTATIPLTVSINAAERMLNVAQNFEKRGGLVMSDGRTSNLTIYIDNDQIASYSVSGVFKDQRVRSPSINLDQKEGESRSDLRQRMKRVEGYLESGSLPEPVEVVSQRTISSRIGGQFMTASVLSIIGSLIAVGFLVYIRYRNPKVVIPIVFTGACEVFILFGSWFSHFATLNLAAIAGIIAAVGTGVDDQIIITDESEEETVKDWKQKMKTAFFVIFTSAASTIGAMTPILSPQFSTLLVGAAGVGLLTYNYFSDRTNSHYIAVGILGILVAVIASNFPLSPLEQIKEFATTTIVGILIGIAITRPAFAKILENIEE